MEILPKPPTTVNSDNKGGLKITRRLPQRLVPNLDRKGFEKAVRSRNRYLYSEATPAPPRMKAPGRRRFTTGTGAAR